VVSVIADLPPDLSLDRLKLAEAASDAAQVPLATARDQISWLWVILTGGIDLSADCTPSDHAPWHRGRVEPAATQELHCSFGAHPTLTNDKNLAITRQFGQARFKFSKRNKVSIWRVAYIPLGLLANVD